MSPAEFIPALIVAMLLAGIIVLNVWDREYRASMTEEERKREDDEVRENLNSW